MPKQLEQIKRCGNCKWWIGWRGREGVCFRDESNKPASDVCPQWERLDKPKESDDKILD
jgi:hypothetical protein